MVPKSQGSHTMRLCKGSIDDRPRTSAATVKRDAEEVADGQRLMIASENWSG